MLEPGQNQPVMIIQPMPISDPPSQQARAEPGAGLNGGCALPHLGVIRVAGADAASFLQGQLTQDFVLLKPEQARLAAFCNPKGRMLASFVGFRHASGDIVLVCSRDILPATLKRLSMFVMRAKARLTDATAEFSLHGLVGDAIENKAINPQQNWGRAQFDDADWITLPSADGVPRVLRVGTANDPKPLPQNVSEADWLWAEVRGGVARITQPVVDAFVPQMLNYESVDGVNFKKGCYPGQEVVARSQFRGAIKRRAFVAHVEGPADAGAEVFTADQPDQPCGLIAQAAPAPGGGTAVIVVLQLAALAPAQPLVVGTPDGAALSDVHMPYQLLDDI